MVTIVGGVVVTILNRKVNQYLDKTEKMEEEAAREKSLKTGKPIGSEPGILP